MKAIILAAGYATRLYPLTKDRPKPLLQVGKATIVEHLLKRFASLSLLNHVYIVTNAKFYPIFSEWAGTMNREKVYPNFEIEIINDHTTSNETRLGAIADIQFVLDQKDVKEDLLVTAGDNIFTFDFRELQAVFDQNNSDVIVAHKIDKLEKLQRTGVVELDGDNRVIGFEEKPENPKSPYACPALYIYKSSTLPLFKRYLSEGQNSDAPGNFITWLHKIVPVCAYVMTARYYDIGNLESYQQVCAELGTS